MSERTNAPRSGGRTAEPRGAASQQRGATGQRGRVTSRDADAGRIDDGRDARGARHAGKTPEPRRGETAPEPRRAETVAERRRGETVAERRRGETAPESRRGDTRRSGIVGEAAGRWAGGAGARGRRPSVDAPVAGTAALQVEVTAAEPLRVSDPATAPRLHVAPPAPISAPRAPFVGVVIGVVIAGVLGILLINTKTNENSFKIADLQKQGTALDNQQQDLENQLVDVSSIGNLDAAARRLGLVKADNPALIRLPDGKLIGVMRPTNGKPAVTAQDAKTGAGTDADKGAANIVPDAGTTATQPGLTQNGTATNGTAATNGTVPANGTATNGTVPANGTAPTAATPNGAASTGNGQ